MSNSRKSHYVEILQKTNDRYMDFLHWKVLSTLKRHYGLLLVLHTLALK